MKIPAMLKLVFCAALVSLPLSALAAPVTGVVTNKTTGKPSSGDRVTLVDPMQGMSEVDKATTDGAGKFSLNSPGAGQYLVRVDHQGASYYVSAANPNGVKLSVYDAAEKVDGITVEANVYEIESANGQLSVGERFYLKNASSPPKTQFNPKGTYEITLPDGAVLDGAAATRPVGMPTTLDPVKLPTKNHYAINVPIEPNQGTKGTMFEIHFHLAYSGKATFPSKLVTPAETVLVFLPKAMTLKPEGDAAYQNVPQDQRIQTFAVKSAKAGQSLGFVISGEGQMPREEQPAGNSAGGAMGGAMGGGAGGESQPAAQSNAPGGGIGAPNPEEDPLSKYKWWIVGALFLVLVIGAAFVLRRSPNAKDDDTDAANTQDAAETNWNEAETVSPYTERTPQFQSTVAPQPVHSAASFMNALKDELFAIETDKHNGLITDTEYAEAKFAIDVLLKRALKKG